MDPTKSLANLSPAREAEVKASFKAAIHGADKTSSRAVYQLYSPATIAKAGHQQKMIDADIARKINRDSERDAQVDKVLVMSRINQTKWKLVDQEQFSQKMLNALRMENGGRDIPQFKKDKYKKKTFNYDEQQLQNIKELLKNNHEVLEKRKSGKFQDSFASKYKITQNPSLFDGSVKVVGT